MEYVISRCVQIKSDIVSADEFEGNARQLLNYGHTVGHAIEALSDFSVTHGSAVAAGMAIISKSSAKKGLCPISCYEDTANLINKFSLSTETQYNASEIANVIENDKKRKGGKITFVLPEKIGKCVLKTFLINETEKFVAAGLNSGEVL